MSSDLSTTATTPITSLFPDVHTPGHTGWTRSYFNNQLCIGLQYPATATDPRVQATQKKAGPHWLIFVRFNNSISNYLSNTIQSSLSVSEKFADTVEPLLPKAQGRQLHNLLHSSDGQQNNSMETWLDKLWQHTGHNPVVSVLDKMSRHLQYDRKQELMQSPSLQNYDVTYNKSLWCAGQGTLHLTTLSKPGASQLTSNTAVSTTKQSPNDQLHEIGFEFDASAIDGAGELIDSNTTWAQKQRRAIMLLSGAANNIPVPMIGTLVNAGRNQLLKMVDDKEKE